MKVNLVKNHVRKLREKFLDFFIKREYRLFQYNSILPIAGTHHSGLLFVNAGIIPIVNEIQGNKSGKRCSIQGCLRLSGKHNDLDEIGVSKSHHTYFEMAGHFAWGENSMLSTLTVAIRFLHLNGLKPDELFLTYHPKHQWAINEVLPKLFRFYEFRKDNTNEWSSGDYGSRGYCIEVYLKANSRGNSCDLEIWNCVYVDRSIDKHGQVTWLSKAYLDSGMGLARLASVISGTFDTYSNLDLKIPINLFKYLFPTLKESSYRIIADHFRSVFFIYQEGIYPGHREQPYILKKLLRRIFWLIFEAGVEIVSIEDLILISYVYSSAIREATSVSIKELQVRSTLRGISSETLDSILLEFERSKRLWKTGTKYLSNVDLSNSSEEEIAHLISEKGYPLELIRKFILRKDFNWRRCQDLIS